MRLSRIASALSFVLAFSIGVVAGYIGIGIPDIGEVRPPGTTRPVTRFEHVVEVDARDLIGVWRGSWGYDSADCTIRIDRIENGKFHGTLTKGGAKIALSGTIDTELRTIFFHETKVLDQGGYGMWSLGTNFGSFSGDGRTLAGSGTDKWGSYGWNVKKD